MWRSVACGALLLVPATACTGDAGDRTPVAGSEARSAPSLVLDAGAPVLGPDGVGAVELGMSRAQAARMLACDTADCSRFTLRDHPGATGCLSEDLGVTAIFADAAMHTPEGVAVGTSLADARAAYPDAVRGVDGWVVPVPGHDDRTYTWLEEAGLVTDLALSLDRQTCFG